MKTVKPFQKLNAWSRVCVYPFLLSLLLAAETPLRAQSPPTYLFQINVSAAPVGFQPAAIALDVSNNVYVTDQENNRVVKFDRNGNYLMQWGTNGSGNGQFSQPRGIAVDASNNVYVADVANNRIEKFDGNGNYLTQWGNAGSGNGQFGSPFGFGVAVDSGGNVYVTDYNNARVEKFTSNGDYLTQWGSAGNSNGQFEYPLGIAVDSQNDVYVADASNARIEKFTSNGNYLTQWGGGGTGNGQFYSPNGIAVDNNNNVYVADPGDGRIDKFNSNGAYLAQWDSSAFEIVPDGSGNLLYAIDVGIDPVQVFANNTAIIPPYITGQPANQAVPAGVNVTFGISVVGAAPFAYQWSSNNIVVPGATNASFTLTNVSLTDSGSAYSVLVTNSYGSTISSNAVLTILPAVEFVVPTYLFQIDSNMVPGGMIPSWVALDAGRNAYVVDTSSNRIVKFNGNGTYLTQGSRYGSDNGQYIQQLQGIALDSGNNVYVADSFYDRIERYTSNGSYLTEWGSPGTGTGQLLAPYGIAVDGKNNIYAADLANNRIEKYSSSGGYLNQWGGEGYNEGQFQDPNGIAVDGSNNIYVVDSLNTRVEKFTSNGTNLNQWGTSGTGNGQFTYPTGIAADSSDYIYVADSFRIQKFDSNGDYLAQWGTSGAGNGQFNGADGIAVDASGNYIYVVDAGNNRVEVFVNNTNIIPPYINGQPTNRIVPAGVNVTFSANVVGGASLICQWIFNDVPLPGVTNTTFTLTNVSLSDSGIYYLLATNSYGSALSSTALLTVLPSIVLTQPASSITTNSAMLNASVTVGPDETVAWFEWGTDTNYGNITDETIVPGNNASNNLSTALNGLTDNVYHYRIDAANDFGIVYGNDEVFAIGTTPTATTLAAVDSGNGTALNATVNPNGLDTAVYFRWGTLILTNLTPVMDVGPGTNSLNASSFITGLIPFNQYYYQVVASNYLGIVVGARVLFLAPPFASAPLAEWQSVAVSADGTKVVAGSIAASSGSSSVGVYVSTNNGATWTHQFTNYIGGVASSADGSILVTGPGVSYGGPILVSTNSGVNWIPATNGPSFDWNSFAASADGSKLVAVAIGRPGIYTSTNSGANWTLQTNGLSSDSGFLYIASSADGSKLVVCASGEGAIFTSTNSGANWIQATNAPLARWYSVASSADGNKLLACAYYGGNVYLSGDAGATWTKTGLPTNNWNSVAESADGTRMVALANDNSSTFGLGNGGIFTSTNSGTTWVSNNVPSAAWTCAAMSADGNEFLATIGSPSTTGGIYLLQTTPAPVLNLSASDNVISWIIPSLGFTLQQSPDLQNWTDVTNQPVLNLTNLQNQVTLPPPDGNSFFRLMH